MAMAKKQLKQKKHSGNQRLSTLLMGILCVYAMSAQAFDNAQALSTVQSAVVWLDNNQNTVDGGWGTDASLRYLSTASAISALRAVNDYSAAYYAGIAWLENNAASNVDYTSRKIVALGQHGNNLSADTNYLSTARRSANNGVGLNEIYDESPLDTALAMQAAVAIGDTVYQAETLAYLLAAQLGDGGWPLGTATSSDRWVTAEAVIALASTSATDPGLTTTIDSAVAFLNGAQITSDTVLLARSILAVYLQDGQTAAVDAWVIELLSRQNAGGDWGDAHSTALALRALAAVLNLDTSEYATRVSMNDQQLRAIINAQLGKNAYDQLVRGELTEVTSLDLRAAGITDLTGLEFASNLGTIQVVAGADLTPLGPTVIVVVDTDSDDIVDASDNCPTVSNPGQEDLDVDGLGNACDADADGDGFTVAGGDFDDLDPTAYPGAVEICDDGVDQDGNAGDAICMGDVNGDKLLTIADLLMLKQHILNLAGLDSFGVLRADLYPVNTGDGMVDLSDLLLLQQSIIAAETPQPR